MAEVPYYNADFKEAINGLAKGLNVKGNILLDSEIIDLTTLGLDYWDDTQATGITGRYNGKTWTLRWDWDSTKLSHINTEYDGRYGTQKAAYMEQSKGDHNARRDLPEAQRQDNKGYPMFLATLKRVTNDADWRKDIWESRRKDKAYRQECAKTLARIWYQRIYAPRSSAHSHGTGKLSQVR